MLKIFLSKTFIFRQILQRRKRCFEEFSFIHSYSGVSSGNNPSSWPTPWSKVKTGRLAEGWRVWSKHWAWACREEWCLYSWVEILTRVGASDLGCRQLYLSICWPPWNSTMVVPQPFVFLEIDEAPFLPNLQNGGNLIANESFHSSCADYPFLVFFYPLHP